MKLAAILFRGFKIPGNRFRGKVRMVKRVTPITLQDVKTDFKIEEQNMLYLRHPFLTLEQSQRLTKELEQDKIPQHIKDAIERDKKYATKSQRLMDQLKTLARDNWDVIK